MTTQQAPHTPPLWRKFLSLPHTRLGWWAVGLSGIALALMAFTNVMGFANTDNPQLAILGLSGSWGGGVLVPLVFFTWALSGVAGAVVALIALVGGQERSALVWVAMLPVLPTLLPLGFIVLVLGDQVGLDPIRFTLPAMVVLILLIPVLISVLIAWSQRHKSEKQR